MGAEALFYLWMDGGQRTWSVDELRAVLDYAEHNAYTAVATNVRIELKRRNGDA